MSPKSKTSDDKKTIVKKKDSSIKAAFATTSPRGQTSEQTTQQIGNDKAESGDGNVLANAVAVSPPRIDRKVSIASKTEMPTKLSLTDFSKQLPLHITKGFLPRDVSGKKDSDQGGADTHFHTLRAVDVGDGKLVHHIIFRCVPMRGCKNVWQEKLFNDAVKNEEAWAKDLSITRTVPWFSCDVPQLNAKQFPIRLFVLDCAQKFVDEEVRNIGNYICEVLNFKNSTTFLPNQKEINIKVPEGPHYYWVDGRVVWSDIIGIDACLKQILPDVLPVPETFFVNNQKWLETFFHHHQLTGKVAELLRVPIESLFDVNNTKPSAFLDLSADTD